MGGTFKSPFRSLLSWRNWREAAPGIVIPWLLRDEFSDTRAAGAVNGTPATPGPGGPRVVVDVNNKLSVGGGVLSVATAGVGVYEPRLYYGTVSRVAGRLFVAAVNVDTEGVRFGLTDINTQVRQSSIRFAQGATIRPTQAGAAQSLDIGTYVVNTDYQIAIPLRAAGEYYLIKGGTFTNWTLLWIDDDGATANVIPATGADDATSVYEHDFIRIPDALYLPTPLAYDTFTRANGPLGNTEGIGPDGQAVSARAWINRVGTTLVAGNTASASALVGGIAIATVDTGTADVLHQANLTWAGGNTGITLRYADANNYVYARHNNAAVRLVKVVAGVTTTVITAASVVVPGAPIVVICEGTQFSLYYNNAKVGVTSTINDAALQNGTEQGVYSTNVGNTQDNMLTMARGTNGEYAGLDKYSG